LFDSFKIKKLLGRYAAAPTGQQEEELLAELKKFGPPAVRATIEAFQQKKIAALKAQYLLTKICSESSMEEIVPLIGDPYDEVRRVAKEITIQKWSKSSWPILVELLKSVDTYSRTNATELLCTFKPEACIPELVSIFNHGSPETKRCIIKVVSQISSRTSTRLVMSALNDQNWQVRLAAVRSLSILKAAESVDLLIDKLVEKDSQMRMLVLEALEAIGDRKAAPYMIDLLRDDDMMVRQRATDCLIHIADAKIVPEVLALMRDKDVNIRRCAIEVLKNLKDPATSEELMRALKDSDWWVRQIATSSLTELHGDNNITRGFITLTRDPDENLRRCAVEFFNKVIDPAAYDALIERLEDEDWWVREKAIRALGKLKNEQAIAPLLNKLDDREVAWSVPAALAAIGGQEAFENLKRLLFADDKRMRIEAIKACACLKSKEAIEAIKECLADPHEEVAAQAIDALKALTGKAYKPICRDQGSGQPTASLATHAITPGSTVTEAILVLDLCNSTDITNRYGDTFSLNLMQTLTNLIAPIARKEQCRFSKGTGDGFLMTFPLAENAVRFARETFVAVNQHNQQADDKNQINIRFSIHQGEAKVDAQGDRLGLAVSMTFRVEGVKPEGIIPIENGMSPEEFPMDNRIVITETVMKELKDMAGINARLVGLFELKGITGLHRIFLLT